MLLSCNVPQKEKAIEVDVSDKMEWWRDARFGMFIHWGLYAIPAGEWKDEQVPGISEWIMRNAKIPVQEYKSLATEFNPEKFNAEEWVLLAKRAGMKYIVITSKHHDGFALFHSRHSDFNIVNATPFDRDPLLELAEACKKHNMRLGFYYSQAQDWTEPGGTHRNMKFNQPHWDSTLVREPLMNYINGKAAPQVREILENYGGLDILWWDTPDMMTEEAADSLKKITDRYPELITNDRLYEPWKGDFTTPEQHVPPTGLDYDWEVCMTMNTSWGYKWYDHNWKSVKTLIHMLVDIASKGGNLLLNVGPTAEGEIPDSSVVRLKQIGQWMSTNSESIYGTTASPFFKLTWGRCTRKDDKLYLHVFRKPENNHLIVPGLKANIASVYLLEDRDKRLSYEFDNDDLIISTASVNFDPINTVIVLQTEGSIEVTNNIPTLVDGNIVLSAEYADLHNPGYGTQAVLNGYGADAYIENWLDKKVKIEWMFQTSEAGSYEVSALINAQQPGTINIETDTTNLQYNVHTTNGFELLNMGEVQLSEDSDQLINLKLMEKLDEGISIKRLILTKSKV
jgi:alpha-L-fucosidase